MLKKIIIEGYLKRYCPSCGEDRVNVHFREKGSGKVRKLCKVCILEQYGIDLKNPKEREAFVS